MIKITDTSGRVHMIHPDAIARITEAGVSGKWHGTLAYVKTFDGHTIDAREPVGDIVAAIAAAKGG